MRLFFPRIARDTRCFNTCSTRDTLLFFGSLISKCTCSGIMTYPISQN